MYSEHPATRRQGAGLTPLQNHVLQLLQPKLAWKGEDVAETKVFLTQSLVLLLVCVCARARVGMCVRVRACVFVC